MSAITFFNRLQTATLVLAVVAIGCGDSDSAYDATVQGTVTIDGELANRGSVTFHPIGKGPTAYATIQQDGSYALRTGQGPLGDVDGGKVRSGEYIVTAVVTAPPAVKQQVGSTGPPMPGPRITAAKYARKKSSDLRFTIDPGSNVIPLELERASEDETAEANDEGAKAKSESDAAETPNDQPADEATDIEETDAASAAEEPSTSPAPADAPEPDASPEAATDAVGGAPLPADVVAPAQEPAEEAKP